MIAVKPLAALAAAPLVAAGLALSATWVVVDVREGGPDGHRVIVPVPVALVRAGLAFAPAPARHLEVPELAAHLPAIERVLSALREAPDGDLVRVETRRERVSVRKTGDSIHVEVHGARGEDVRVELPLEAAARALRAYDGRAFHTRTLVAALGGASRTDLVHVRDGDTEVRVRVW